MNDYTDWGDIDKYSYLLHIDLCYDNSIWWLSDNQQFIESDYDIHDLRDIPIPFGLEIPILHIKESSTKHIEKLIEEIPFLSFECTYN